MSSPSTPNVRELDILRGLAAILMIFNHAGFELLTPDGAGKGTTGGIVFIGSFAPVLFFFATGFGVGLSATNAEKATSVLSALWKALLLVLADQVVYWANGKPFGLDFFSFIGIALVFVTLISKSQRPRELCLIIIVASITARYLIGPLAAGALPDFGTTEWLFGLHGLDGISYPFSPWMVYPLLGYVIGSRYLSFDFSEPFKLRQALIVAVAALMAIGAALYGLIAAHAVIFRWGTVSAAYFLASIMVLLTLALVSVIISTTNRTATGVLSLRGVSSFAIIPIHYGLLKLMDQFTPRLSLGSFAVLTLILTVTSFLFASAFSRYTASWLASPKANRPDLILFTLLALATGIATGLPIALDGPKTFAVISAQLCVAALLGLRMVRRAEKRGMSPSFPLKT